MITIRTELDTKKFSTVVGASQEVYSLAVNGFEYELECDTQSERVAMDAAAEAGKEKNKENAVSREAFKIRQDAAFEEMRALRMVYNLKEVESGRYDAGKLLAQFESFAEKHGSCCDVSSHIETLKGIVHPKAHASSDVKESCITILKSGKKTLEEICEQLGSSFDNFSVKIKLAGLVHEKKIVQDRRGFYSLV